MAMGSALVLHGNLGSDGTIRLDTTPDLPPGRIRITLRLLPPLNSEAIHLPDGPWLDDAISAPGDLPLSGVPERVFPREALELLPDPYMGTEEGAE
jgi:hypothetical protein